jgi:RNA polymerase sigma-70 factor (ECF subfamily)
MDLVVRARDGDADALGALFRAHQHLLLRYFRVRGAPSPEDLASQVWLDVATGLPRFEGGDDDFRRWLFTIARRRDVDRVRQAVRRPTTPVADAGATRIDEAATDAFDRGDALDRALALVRTLPPDQADAVALRVIADLDVPQVAAIMGKREGHVRVLVHRGLRRLATALDAGTGAGAPDVPRPVAVTPRALTAMDGVT